MPTASQLVTAIVIGRNEAEHLRACLASVNAMQRDGFDIELLYVDSNSTDNSIQIAEDSGARVFKIEGPTTAALARNTGWREARGEIILFLDGDTVLDPDFVRTALPSFADESILAGEEPDMCRRMRAHSLKILRMDVPMVMHDLAITKFSQYWRRSTRTGYAYAQVSARYAATPLPLWSREAKSNILRAVALTMLFNISILCALLTGRFWPLLIGVLFFCSLVQRTALKARSKTLHIPTRLLYGIHSHLQQIPIFIGQLNYRTRRHKSAPKLIEYK